MQNDAVQLEEMDLSEMCSSRVLCLRVSEEMESVYWWETMRESTML